MQFVFVEVFPLIFQFSNKELVIDLKDKMQRSKKSAARAKAKKQAASKDPKGGNLDTPKKKERS